MTDDSSITPMLVNSWLNDAIALAAKTNYTDAVKLDGIGYVNNSFYTTFKGLAPVKDEKNLWKITLPQVPVGVGVNEGISTLQLKDTNGNLSLPCIPISENQKTYFQSLPNLPNKTIYYNEGKDVFVLSNLKLSDYTASVTMVSGGDSTNLNSTINVPSDYMPIIVQYVQQQLILQKSRPQDVANDGADMTMN